MRMRGIKHLPKSVHSSLRSSIILFDLTRVVEELVFNSLDAGATKVFVSVNIGACYVKIEDNGCGISREALALVGEKYASSKLQSLDDMDTDIECLGFRGVTLGSLSDVSLVEVLTKARGKPNGYRKIIKGCKCLFLGVDDHRQEAGTTDAKSLFEIYFTTNQFEGNACNPAFADMIRFWLSHECLGSPKKVLHSVKKSIFQTSFVYSHVSFKITDIESETELLCTNPSSSPLPLVTSCFGNEVSSSLQELNFSEGSLKLCGYLSCPGDTLTAKSFQYVYINSRAVCNGPIHKLINSMASQCDYSLRKGELGQKRRKQKLQANVAYILNLCCPQSSYDLTFEPSKTRVDFKDWSCTLSFIEQAIKQLWGPVPSFLSQGELHADKDCVSGKGETWNRDENIVSPLLDSFTAGPSSCYINKKRGCHIQDHKFSLCLSPNISPPKMSSTEADLLPYQKKSRMSSTVSHSIQLPEVDLLSKKGKSGALSKRFDVNSAEYRQFQSKGRYAHPMEESSLYVASEMSDSYDESSEVFTPKQSILQDDKEFFYGRNYFLSRDYLLGQTVEDDEEDGTLGPRWRNKSLEVKGNKWEGSTWSKVTRNHFESEDDTGRTLFSSSQAKRVKKDMIGNSGSKFFSNHRGFEINFDDFSAHKKTGSPDDIIDALETDYNDANSGFFTVNPPMTHSMRKCQTSMELNVKLKSSDFTHSSAGDVVCIPRESGVPQCSLAEEGEKVSDCLSVNPDSFFPSSNDGPDTTLWTRDDFPSRFSIGRNFLPEKAIFSRCFDKAEEKDNLFRHCTQPHTSRKEECLISSCINTELDNEKCFSHWRTSDEHLWNGFEEIGSTGEFCQERDHLHEELMETANKRNSCNIFSPSNQKMGGRWSCKLGFENHGECQKPKARSRRSCSAPPFYRGKSKFSLLLYSDVKTPNQGTNKQFPHNAASPVTISEDSSVSCRQSQADMKTIMEGNSPMRPRLEEKCYNMSNTGRMQEVDGFVKSQNVLLCPTDAIQEIVPFELEDSEVALTKWRDGSAHAKAGEKLNNSAHEDGILDISSGLLHLSGSSLIPESIHKDFLESVNVLLQLDKKFIPVVAGGILAIIDQHAADERIRLEELHRKVLSGEDRTVAYLDSEQELVLPEMGLQLLQNYAEQIQDWGWKCNIDFEGSGSFLKDMNLLVHRQPFVVTLAAVPCVLGIKLSDKDLIEFLQQLADTDGSSTTPPAVLRILNLKACRGAIMFGDSLLPAECSLIVEELKATSLCFQCAHGRPTTVPIVNLDALHKQLTKLSLQNGDPSQEWHGLRRHKPSLERAKMRFASACKR